jgi:hypothetical protein
MISTDSITPLEVAALNAYDFAVGLGVTALIQDLIKQGDEAKLGMRDRSLPDEVRAQAIRSGREANQQLMLVAAAQAAIGISA